MDMQDGAIYAFRERIEGIRFQAFQASKKRNVEFDDL